MIDGEEKSLKIGNLIDCADKLISEDAADELIAAAINIGDSTDFADDDAGGLVADTNAGNSMDCADL